MKKTILILGAAAFVGLIVHPIQAQSKTEKEAAVSKYQGKRLIVKIDGISVGFTGEGLCAVRPGAANLIGDAGDVQVTDQFQCGTEPIHKGEVLIISKVHLFSIHKGHYEGDYLDLLVENVSPHAIMRGVGAFAHQSMERGKAGIAIHVADFDAVDARVAQWFTLVDSTTPADAVQLGNTAFGVFVNQVKADMSFAEVESALGVPQTRIDLGEKVLYKYKDMTVEFHDGKVADVR
jgi:hypothetical protein